MSNIITKTESGLVKTKFGKISGVIVNSHSSGTIKLIDGLESAVAASQVITSAGACAPADYAVGTLTSDATNVSDNDTVVVGATGGTSITYRFKNTMAQAYDVKIGADAATSLANLKKAINATGTAGTEYFAGTLVNPDIIASTLTATTLLVGFRTIGTGGNAYTTTETSSHLSWGGATLAGGVTAAAATITIDSIVYTAVKTLTETLGLTAVANQVKWVTSEAVFLDNLKAAINLSGTAGTDYSTGTALHPTVVATTNTNTQQTVVSKALGSASNSIATTTTLANYSWGAATLASGTGQTGKIMLDTYTLASGSSTIIFNDPLKFDTALYLIIGGTSANLSLIVD